MIRNRIAYQLTAGLIIIVLISMLAIGIIFLQMFKQYAFNNHEELLFKRARTISEMVSGQSKEMMMGGMGAWLRPLDALAEAKIWITDDEGNPISMSNRHHGRGHMMQSKNNISSEPLPDDARQVILGVLKGQEIVSRSFSDVYQEATLTVGAPIFLNNQITGAVLLHAPVTGIRETMDRALHILLISLLLALFLAAALGTGYSLFFTRPLQAMNLTALEMTKGNYTVETGVNRQDELGQLGNSLDLLARQLDESMDQLFQEKNKLNDIIASISEGLIAFNRDLKIQSTNQALAQIMNRRSPYEDITLKEDLQNLGLYDHLQMVIHKQKPIGTTHEWLGKTLRFTLSPIFSSGGKITGCVALVQDISASERLEQVRRDFVANVSHEFRTPLTVLQGSLEALLDGTVYEKYDVERFYQRMYLETTGMERLVQDLLELSRLQSGKIVLHQEKIHLPAILTDITKNIQTLADKKDIKIQMKTASNISPILGDYDRLRQLFIIFLDNAIKYSPDQSLISLNIAPNKQRANHMQITIKDQGPGISEKDLPHIWDRFYKGDASRKSQGTGLGLSIAQHLIKLHHGEVFIHSSLGEGTMVEINLPIINNH